MAVDEVHDIEGAFVHRQVFAESDGAGHRYIAVLKCIDHPELAAHIVCALKHLKQRWAAQNPLAVGLIRDLKGQVRVASCDQVEMQWRLDSKRVFTEPCSDVVTVDSLGCHLAPQHRGRSRRDTVPCGSQRTGIVSACRALYRPVPWLHFAARRTLGACS